MQDLNLSRLQSRVLIAAFILFILCLLWGGYSGYRLGQSKETLKKTSNIYEALKMYRIDQGRYPSAYQFSDKNLLVAYGYLDQLPKPVASGTCSAYSNFIYTQKTPDDFSLSFCLNRSTGGYKEGINTITNP